MYGLFAPEGSEFGDQIGVRIVGSGAERGRPLIVPTEPFLITNTETTYTRWQSGTLQTVRVDHTARTEALDKNTDTRPPFFQQQLVTARLEVPAKVEQPYVFTLTGGDDAVEPNARITVQVGRHKFETTADDLGRFALKVRDIIPGQRLSIEVRDIHGVGIDIPARVPSVVMQAEALLSRMTVEGDCVRVSSSATYDSQTGLAQTLVPPGGALITRNVRTGEIAEIVADDKGNLEGLLRMGSLDSFEFAVRDVNGHISHETSIAVVMPQGSVELASAQNARQPDLATAFALPCGAVRNDIGSNAQQGGERLKGPFLQLPFSSFPPVPPYAALEAVKDGVVVKTFRADDKGRFSGLLHPVHPGDALTFWLSDAAGRRFPQEVRGFVVPGGNNSTSSRVFQHTPPALTTLPEAVTRIGSGTLELDPVWLTPAEVLFGNKAPTDFQQRFAITSQAGGAVLQEPSKLLLHRFFPDLASQGAAISLQQSAGQKTLTIDLPGVSGLPFGISIDDTLAQIRPMPAVPAGLPQLTTALRASLALVAAAYGQGKEPGDVAYDRAMGAAKMLLFVFDRLGVGHAQDPGALDQIQQAVRAAFPPDGFPFELLPRGVVADGKPILEPVVGKPSASINLLQARNLALGTAGPTPNLRGQSRRAVELAAVEASFEATRPHAGVVHGDQGPWLRLTSSSAIAAGDDLLVRVGNQVFRATADEKGRVDLAIGGVLPGSVIEIAQRGPGETEYTTRRSNPVRRAVVSERPLAGHSSLLVPVEKLAQKAPDVSALGMILHARTDAGSIDVDGLAGLPPGGALVVSKDGVTVATARADERGCLRGSLNLGTGAIVDVQVNDAAGRPFAPELRQMVIGQAGSGKLWLAPDAMSLRDCIAEVGSGRLALPSLKKHAPELYNSVDPLWGTSSSIEESYTRSKTKADVPGGLMPDLAKGSGRDHGLGRSFALSFASPGPQEAVVQASFYADNQHPNVRLVYKENTGTILDWKDGKPVAVPGGLSRLTTVLQTAIAFMALGQKLGSEPGDTYYDAAARSAKAVLAMFDRLIQLHPTYRTEILGALRASLPPTGPQGTMTLPFDLPPVANTGSALQAPPTDNVPSSLLSFWRTVEDFDVQQRVKREPYYDSDDFSRVPVRGPAVSQSPGFGFVRPQPASATGVSNPLFMRG